VPFPLSARQRRSCEPPDPTDLAGFGEVVIEAVIGSGFSRVFVRDKAEGELRGLAAIFTQSGRGLPPDLHEICRAFKLSLALLSVHRDASASLKDRLLTAAGYFR